MTMNTIHKWNQTTFQKKHLNTTGLNAKDSFLMNWRLGLEWRILKGGPFNFICKSHKYKAPSQPHKATCSLYRITMTSSKETCYRTPWENRASCYTRRLFLRLLSCEAKCPLESCWLHLDVSYSSRFALGNKELWSLGRDWLTPHNPPSHYPRYVHQTPFTTPSK